MKKKVVCALSGGVDSAVSAWILKQQGYEVEALFMQNWEDEDPLSQCQAREDLNDAKAVCQHLNIPLHTVNFAPDYWHHVFTHFLKEYEAGRTPNPDILCNREIKFKVFADTCAQFGADFMATGHYVRRHYANGNWQLKKGRDDNKDQSYFLYTLNQDQIDFSLFPIGTMQKPQIRDLAKKIGLPNHAKKDSTGICFIGERKFSEFLKNYLPPKPGPIVTTEGCIMGEHKGLFYYTLGQRKGLQIGGRQDAQDAPWYVVAKDMKTNQLIVAQGEDTPLLQSHSLTAKDCHWINHPPMTQKNLTAKIRYRQQDSPCELNQQADGTYHVEFSQPQRAVTPGQSIVFYQNDVCLGGGIIH